MSLPACSRRLEPAFMGRVNFSRVGQGINWKTNLPVSRLHPTSPQAGRGSRLVRNLAPEKASGRFAEHPEGDVVIPLAKAI